MYRSQFTNINPQKNQFTYCNNSMNYVDNNNYNNNNNFSLNNPNPIPYSINNSYNSNLNQFQIENLNSIIYKTRYPNSSFDFNKKMDYLLLTNAFTKLRNENKTYEELENLALKLEISNIKYSQKFESMKYDMIRLNQKIIDLNSIIKENEIENKKLINQVNFLGKDREMMFSRIQTQELNFFNSENTNTKMVQSQATDQDNNLIDNKYLVRTSNDLDNNPLTGYISENSKENNNNNNIKNNQDKRKKSEIKQSDFDDNFNSNEENDKKKEFDSIIEDTDSSLIEGFENNESLLDSIKRRENKQKSANDKNEPKSINWKFVLTCDEREKKTLLNKINNFGQIKKENKKLQNELEDCNSKVVKISKENKSLENLIEEKDEIIKILYIEMDSLKKEIYYLNQELNQKSNKNKKNEFDKFSDNNNELSDISPTTPDVDSEYNSPALKKIKHFIKENSFNKNAKNLNTPSTVNKNYFYKNNSNYENFLNKKNIYGEKENCIPNSLLIKNSFNKSQKGTEQIAKEKTLKKKYFEKNSNYENEENQYQGLNTDFADKPNSIRLSKNNFTFQENEILKQNDSSNFNSYQNNNFNNSDCVLKCENDKKVILKSLEDLKKDLDLFLKDYGIKEQFNKDNQSALANNGIDFQIEYKFKEIRYITVNLKKINIIFKSLLVEFTKSITSNMDKMNECVNKKLYNLQNKISFATGEITEDILKNY